MCILGGHSYFIFWYTIKCVQYSKKTIFNALELAVALFVIYFLVKLTVVPLFTSNEFEMFTKNVGVWGYGLVLAYIVLSEVVAPLAGTPAIVLGMSLYGAKVGFLLLYSGGLISSVINFWISRWFGRDWVIKFVGKKAMREVDHLTVADGRKLLFFSRVFGFSIFEFISYAAGLTTMPFKDYLIITATASILPTVVFYFVFQDVNFRDETGIMLWIGSIVITGIVFGLLVKSYLNKKKKHLPTD